MNKRVVTGVVAGSVFAAAIFLPLPGIFFLLISALMVSASYEYAALSGFKSSATKAMYCAVLLVMLFVLYWLIRSSSDTILRLMIFAATAWLLMIPLLVRFDVSQEILKQSWLIAALGMVFLLSTAGGLMWLHEQEHGRWKLSLLVGLVVLADTFAYYAGKRFGKNRLAEHISPGKTFEGMYGGLMANFVLSSLLVFFFRTDMLESLTVYAVILGVSLCSILGDLTESAIKRSSGVKDSGDWLPGHGGILDRIDGLMAATPFYVLAILAAFS